MNEGPRTVARGLSQLWCFGKAPLGPYQLALLRGLLLRGFLRLLLAALAVHFLALSPGLLLHLVLPVGVAHGLRLLSCLSFLARILLPASSPGKPRETSGF